MIRNEFGPRSPRRARTSLSLSLVLFFLGLPLGGVRALTKTAARSLRHVVESQEHSGGDDVSHGPGGEHVHKGHACWEHPREKERKNRVARSVSLPNFPNRQKRGAEPASEAGTDPTFRSGGRPQRSKGQRRFLLASSHLPSGSPENMSLPESSRLSPFSSLAFFEVLGAHPFLTAKSMMKVPVHTAWDGRGRVRGTEREEKKGLVR